MTRDELIAKLGEPDDISHTTKRHKYPLCYKYGDMEYYFGYEKDAQCNMIMEASTHRVIFKSKE